MPYSNWYVVASPPGLTVPVTAAEPVVTDSAAPVVAVGAAWARTALRMRAAMCMTAFEHANRQDDAQCRSR